MIVTFKLLHLLSLAVAFGLTTANLLIFRYTADLAAGERALFGPLQRQLSAIGLLAIVLLWITGVGLYLLIWLGAPVSVWFWGKMAFVVALTGLAITARKTASAAIADGKAPPAHRMRQYSHLVAAAGFGAMVTAVIAFNA